MNINSYIRKFGKYTFEERPFNHVDALIFSELSMISFEPVLKDKEFVTLKDIELKDILKEMVSDSPDKLYNKNQIRAMVESDRYKDLTIKYMRREFSKELVNQFYAITILFPNGDFYVSYRGTDVSMIGWKEDFLLATQDTYLGQEQALDYLRSVIQKEQGRFYIGGHSKGGNLAFYSTLHLTEEESQRLIESYSFDGPGMRKDIKELPSYPFVIDKMVKFRTYNNVIGATFNQMDKYKVVHSTGLLFGGHDLYYWQISPTTGDFSYAKDISSLSKKYSDRFMKWVESLPIEDRKLATNTLFEVFHDCNDIYDLAKNWVKDLLNIKKSLNNYSEEDQKKLKMIFKTLLQYLFNFNKVKKD